MCLFWHVNGRLYGSDYGPPGDQGVLTTWRKCCRQRGQRKMVTYVSSGCGCLHSENLKDSPIMVFSWAQIRRATEKFDPGFLSHIPGLVCEKL